MMGTVATRRAGALPVFLALAMVADTAIGGGKTADAKADHGQSVQSGVAVAFSLQSPDGRNPPGKVVAGEETVVRFALTDTATHAPMKGLHPAAWMDLRKDGGTPRDCRDMIRSFLQTGLGARPDLDLNTYYILALNDQPSISVIDPLLGVGSSRLVTQVLLKSTGEDWVLSSDRKRLYVTLPQSGEVAVVDTAAWKVVRGIPAGARPARLALQPDGNYLWVADDGAGGKSGVRVIDPAKLEAVAEFPTGTGHHELAFSDDNRYAFVSNGQNGTVSILDVPRLARIKDIPTGAVPVSLAFSPLAKTLYVAHADGLIAAVDPRRQEIQARIKTAPGLRVVRFSPDGRWAFAANGKDGKVYIVDASTHRLAHAVAVGPELAQISFTDQYAYIRSDRTADIGMIRLNTVDGKDTPPVVRFPGGQGAPGLSSHPSVADAVVRVPESDAVLVANPVDRTIYYYTEGMNAPMGNFQNYGSEPRAVQVLDRSLAETAPGVYSAHVRLPQSGTYDVALVLDNPRFHQCFVAQVEPNKDPEQRGFTSLRVEYLIGDRKIHTQVPTRLRFRLFDPETGHVRDGLKDVVVQSLLAPGLWHRREVARPLGEGHYEVELTAPKPGVYYVHLSCPSLGVRYDQLPALILQAVKEGDGQSATSEKP